jgi:hypothetical protein
MKHVISVLSVLPESRLFLSFFPQRECVSFRRIAFNDDGLATQITISIIRSRFLYSTATYPTLPYPNVARFYLSPYCFLNQPAASV